MNQKRQDDFNVTLRLLVFVSNEDGMFLFLVGIISNTFDSLGENCSFQ